MNANESEEPKIIVDEDWKAQVQQEKEQLKGTAGAPPSAGAEEPAGEIPPASFLSLLSMLGAQAMTGLGLIPDPFEGKPVLNRPLAKHWIDTLGVLQEKTQGNLSEEEAGHLRDALHQLRMVYVSTGNAGAAAPGAEPGTGSSTIELP